jgi:hypothetical protein
MYPSTDPADAQREFATDMLRNLLRRIDAQNMKGRDPFLVSHGWTEGPMTSLVYTAPPYDITWGLARDTRRSITGPGPWPDVDEAVTFYYLLDLEEGSATSEYPREPDTILWCGFPLEGGLLKRPSDIPDEYRYTPPPGTSSANHRRDQDPPIVNKPRRYADPP